MFGFKKEQEKKPVNFASIEMRKSSNKTYIWIFILVVILIIGGYLILR